MDIESAEQATSRAALSNAEGSGGRVSKPRLEAKSDTCPLLVCPRVPQTLRPEWRRSSSESAKPRIPHLSSGSLTTTWIDEVEPSISLSEASTRSRNVDRLIVRTFATLPMTQSRGRGDPACSAASCMLMAAGESDGSVSTASVHTTEWRVCGAIMSERPFTRSRSIAISARRTTTGPVGDSTRAQTGERRPA